MRNRPLHYSQLECGINARFISCSNICIITRELLMHGPGAYFYIVFDGHFKLFRTLKKGFSESIECSYSILSNTISCYNSFLHICIGAKQGSGIKFTFLMMTRQQVDFGLPDEHLCICRIILIVKVKHRTVN